MVKVAKSGLKTREKVWKSWSAIKGTNWDSKTSKIICKLLVSIDRFFSGGSVCNIVKLKTKYYHSKKTNTFRKSLVLECSKRNDI